MDQCLKFELEAELVGVELEAELMNVEILDVDSQDEVSVLTMTDEAEGLFTSPSTNVSPNRLDRSERTTSTKICSHEISWAISGALFVIHSAEVSYAVRS